jgi:hypothetical protein
MTISDPFGSASGDVALRRCGALEFRGRHVHESNLCEFL